MMSSRTKLPKDMPPHDDMPPMRLPARLSLRFRPTWLSRFELLTVMGFGPALTKESCRLRLMAESRAGPTVMSTSSVSVSKSVFKLKFRCGNRSRMDAMKQGASDSGMREVEESSTTCGVFIGEGLEGVEMLPLKLTVSRGVRGSGVGDWVVDEATSDSGESGRSSLG
jgi:hypothetical protein